MESQSRIGIYLRKDRATVVCLASQGREKKLLDSFCVTAQDQGQHNQQVLADQIAKRCAERRLKIAEASVALDCSLFMQHRLHSDFSDPKKIAATVRFDTEETLATDISNLAVAFRVVSSSDNGTELDVFTTERGVLTDILLSLQSNGIDPLTIEPDVCLLSQCLSEMSASRHGTKDSSLYALLSDRRGYLVGVAGSHSTVMRAFPVSAAQNRNELLAREILLSAALVERSEPPQKLYVTDAAGSLDAQELQAKVRMPVETCDPAALMGTEAPKAADGPNLVDLAIAFGAALPQGEKADGVNFRNDHMPHMGKKIRLRNAVRFFSVAWTIAFLAVGVLFQTQYLKTQRDRERVWDTFAPKYVAVMLDRRLPRTIRMGRENLESLLRWIKQQKSGQWGGQESVSAKLTLVLQALNSCAAATDLKIESIEISSTRIAVTGNTSNRANTNKVFAAMAAAKLELSTQGYEERNGRDTFRMTLKPMKDAGKEVVNEADKGGGK